MVCAFAHDAAEARAALVTSQLIGLAFCRYILVLQPLADWPADKVVDAVAPTIQGYLVSPL